MNLQLFKSLLQRDNDSYKYSFGHVLVIGGSPGMVGAPLLSAEAALRSGAGLVSLGSTEPVIDKLEKRVEEIMTVRLPDTHKGWEEVLSSYIDERKISVIVIGPGMLPDEYTGKYLEYIIRSSDVPLIIDGGALASLAHNLSLLKIRSENNIILTPHSGEFQRLIDRPLPKSSEETRTVVSDFAQKYRICLVLKGHHTLIAGPGKQLNSNDTGNPGLATAGSGDVLSGIIAGLLAQHLALHDAARAGVYLHGLAGDIAVKQTSEPGLIASDIIAAIPSAYKEIQSQL